MAEELAARVRSEVHDGEYDLSGYTDEAVRSFVALAFKEPLCARRQLVLTFVVGGYKKV